MFLKNESKIISLDLDGYQLAYFIKYLDNMEQCLREIDQRYDIENVKVYESKKGFNLIICTKLGVDETQQLYYRLIMFDDLFRLRADVFKLYKKQDHRINRIWINKDWTDKKEIIDITFSKNPATSFLNITDLIVRIGIFGDKKLYDLNKEKEKKELRKCKKKF
jgi:hypothetical protein